MDPSVKRMLRERGARSKEHRSTGLLNGILECTLGQADRIGKRENYWPSVDSSHCFDDVVCESTLEILVNFSQGHEEYIYVCTPIVDRPRSAVGLT